MLREKGREKVGGTELQCVVTEDEVMWSMVNGLHL